MKKVKEIEVDKIANKYLLLISKMKKFSKRVRHYNKYSKECLIFKIILTLLIINRDRKIKVKVWPSLTESLNNKIKFKIRKYNKCRIKILKKCQTCKYNKKV